MNWTEEEKTRIRLEAFKAVAGTDAAVSCEFKKQGQKLLDEIEFRNTTEANINENIPSLQR